MPISRAMLFLYLNLWYIFILFVEQASKYPEQGPVLSVKETSAESAEGMCTSCGKTKEKKLCTHRHHPYPQSPKPSQFQDPVPPSQNRGKIAILQLQLNGVIHIIFFSYSSSKTYFMGTH